MRPLRSILLLQHTKQPLRVLFVYLMKLLPCVQEKQRTNSTSQSVVYSTPQRSVHVRFSDGETPKHELYRALYVAAAASSSRSSFSIPQHRSDHINNPSPCQTKSTPQQHITTRERIVVFYHPQCAVDEVKHATPSSPPHRAVRAT